MSQSFAIHGWPWNVWESSSTWGSDPLCQIRWPIGIYLLPDRRSFQFLSLDRVRHDQSQGHPIFVQHREEPIWFPVQIEICDKSVGKQLISATVNERFDAAKDQVSPKIVMIVNISL